MKAIRALVAGLAVAGAASLVAAVTNPNNNDVNTLNFALQLEQFELDLYTQGYEKFQVSDYTTAGIPASVRDYVGLIVNHEQAHVNTLTGVVSGPISGGGYGATASPSCAQSAGGPGYAYPANTFSNVQNFLNFAIAVEGVGVGAYTGALNTLSNVGVQQAAATIATVEARHVSFLSAYAGTSAAGNNNPFPAIFNPAYNFTQVLAAAGTYFAGCPYGFNATAIRPSGVASGSALLSAAAPTSSTPASPAPTYTQAEFDQDNNIFNYALTLENLENDFYTHFYNMFTADQYNAVPGVQGKGAAVVTNIAMVQAHESAHVSAIQGLLANRGATAVSAGCYDWSSITDAATFLSVAALLENTGVSAYDGAANGITDTVLQQIAASVATVEARHAAYLNTLNGHNASQLAFMNGQFDQALNMSQIVSAATAALVPKYVTALSGGCSSSGSGSGSGSSSTGPNGGAAVAVAQTVSISNQNVPIASSNTSGVNAYGQSVVNNLIPQYSDATFVSATATPTGSSGRRLLETSATSTIVTNMKITTADTLAQIQAKVKSVYPNAAVTTQADNSQNGAASTIGASIATLALAAVAVLLL